MGGNIYDPYGLREYVSSIEYDPVSLHANASSFRDSRDGVMDDAQFAIESAINPRLRANMLDPEGELRSVGIDTSRLQPFSDSHAAQMRVAALLDPNGAAARLQDKGIPQTTDDQGKYGDMRMFSVVFNAINPILDFMVLPRPANRRLILILQNTGINPIYWNFDAEAWVLVPGAVTITPAGLILPPGGTVGLDTFVPQNDLHLSAAGLVSSCTVVYSNSNP